MKSAGLEQGTICGSKTWRDGCDVRGGTVPCNNERYSYVWGVRHFGSSPVYMTCSYILDNVLLISNIGQVGNRLCQRHGSLRPETNGSVDRAMIVT